MLSRLSRQAIWAAALIGAASVAYGQNPARPAHDHDAAPSNAQGKSGMQMVDMNEARVLLMNFASGTSQNPAAWPMPMLMKPFGSWNTMFM
jgi:hypothetical protein